MPAKLDQSPGNTPQFESENDQRDSADLMIHNEMMNKTDAQAGFNGNAFISTRLGQIC